MYMFENYSEVNATNGIEEHFWLVQRKENETVKNLWSFIGKFGW